MKQKIRKKGNIKHINLIKSVYINSIYVHFFLSVQEYLKFNRKYWNRGIIKWNK